MKKLLSLLVLAVFLCASYGARAGLKAVTVSSSISGTVTVAQGGTGATSLGNLLNNTGGVFNVSMAPNVQTGSYTIAATDAYVILNSATAATFTLPQAGSTGFVNGWCVNVSNVGAGILTVSPTTSTISGAVAVVGQNGWINLCSNGTNYYAQGGTDNIIVSSSATAFSVGQNGVTTPAFNVDASASSQACGIDIIGSATNSNVQLNTAGTGNCGLNVGTNFAGMLFNGSGTTFQYQGSTEFSIVSGGVTLGGTLGFPSGRKGTFVCTSGGSIVVSNTLWTTTSIVLVSMNTPGGTVSWSPNVKTATAGTSLTFICATSDTSTYNYTIVN